MQKLMSRLPDHPPYMVPEPRWPPALCCCSPVLITVDELSDILGCLSLLSITQAPPIRTQMPICPFDKFFLLLVCHNDTVA